MNDKMLEAQEDRMHNIRCCEDLLEKAAKEDRELSDEERSLIREWTAKADKATARIKSLEEQEELAKQVMRSKEAVRPTQPRKTEPISDFRDDARVEVRPMMRTGSLRAFRGPDAELRAYKSGKFLRGLLFDDKLAQQWCREQGLEVRALNTYQNTAGGALVPEEFLQAVIDNREKYGVLRQVITPTPMKGDVIHMPVKTSGNTAYWVGEGASGTESDAKWGNVQLTAKKLMVLTRMSSELAEDAVIDLAEDMAMEFAQAFAYEEDRVAFNGTGLSTDGGIHGICAKIVANGDTFKSWVDPATGHDTFAEIDANDIGAVMGACPTYAKINAKFFCSGVCADAVFGRLMAAGGGNRAVDLSERMVRRYLGYEIVESQVLETSTDTVNDKPFLLFGDLSRAMAFGERRGIMINSSSERYFENDQIGVKATERIDIVTHDVGTASQAGPIVALMGKTS